MLFCLTTVLSRVGNFGQKNIPRKKEQRKQIVISDGVPAVE
jgi:hypothetical protein